jgi:hypothetical protein
MALNVNWGSLFKQLAIGVAINIAIQALTGGGDDAPDPGMPKPPESDPDKPLPLFWGTHRLGINVYREVKTYRREVKEDKTFLGIRYGSRVTGYDFYMTACAWLGYGKLQGHLDWIINGTKVLSRAAIQSYQVTGVPLGGLTQDGQAYTSQWNQTMTGPPMNLAINFGTGKFPNGGTGTISARNILGDAGGVAGVINIYPGDGSHLPNPQIAAIDAVLNPGYEEPVYSEWAYLVFNDVYMGRSPQFPSIEVVASRSVPMLGSGLPLMPYEQRVFRAMGGFLPAGFVEGDANPAGILWEMMTNHKTGLGIPHAFMYKQDWINVWEQLVSENFGLSHRIETIRASEDDVNDVLRHIDGVIYFDLQKGQYRLRLLRPYTGDISTLPLLDKSVLTSVEYAESAINQNVNQVNVEFTNVYRDLLKDVVKVQNLAAIQQAQRFNAQTVQYMSITRPSLALQVAQRDLRVQSSILGRGSFVGNRYLLQYTPGQLVRILWPEKGLYGKVVRIGEIDYGSLDDGKISGTFIEDYWSMEAPSYEAELPAQPTVPGDQYIAPTVEVLVAIDTLVSVVYNLLITDPQLRVTAVEYSEQVGDGAATAWVADTDTVYDYEMLKNPVYSTRAFYRVSYTDDDGVTQYLVGEFPQPTVGTTGLSQPVLSFVYSGTDVIVTATLPNGATGIRFASAMDTPPSDAAVLVGTLDSTGPYAYTTPAPVGTQMLHVGALATDGVQNSRVARIAIPPKPIDVDAAIAAAIAAAMIDPTIQYPFGNGAVMGVAGDWLRAAPDFNGTTLRWKVRALDENRAQVPFTGTFSVKKVRESDQALIDMVGGVLSVTADDENAENGASATGWAVPTFSADDDIIVTLESLTAGSAVKSLLFTLTVKKV